MAALDATTPEGFDYYDVDSILADEVMVPCALVHGCTGVGQVIDPSSDAPDLPPAAKVELPLWMVPVMARRHLLGVSLPLFFGDRMRRKVKAGAACEDLRVRCSYFYTAAGRVHAAMQATGSADETFPAFVSSTFTGRFRDLLTKAPVVESNAEASAVQAKLTNEELALFNAAAEAAAAHDRFRANKDDSGPGGAANRARAHKRPWPGGQENRLPAR